MEPGNLTEGERRAGNGPRRPTHLHVARASLARGVRRELGPHDTGNGHRSLFAHTGMAAGGRNWLEGAGARAWAERWSLLQVGGRTVLRAGLHVSGTGRRRKRREAGGWGDGFGLGGLLLILVGGLLPEHLLRGHDLLAFSDKEALVASALLPATVARVALDRHQEAMVPAPRAFRGALHLVGQLGNVCLHWTTATSGSC